MASAVTAASARSHSEARAQAGGVRRSEWVVLAFLFLRPGSPSRCRLRRQCNSGC
jgi:hypothetical protein